MKEKYEIAWRDYFEIVVVVVCLLLLAISPFSLLIVVYLEIVGAVK